MREYYYPRTQEEYDRLIKILESKGFHWGLGKTSDYLNMFFYKGSEIVIYLIGQRISWCHKRQLPISAKEIEIKA